VKDHDMTEPVRRVHYFSGQLLTPEDLQAEQDYHRQMRYLHNRLLGRGIVQGFEVAVGAGDTVTVSPGVAIDGCGRELVLTGEVQVELIDPAAPDGYRVLVATWDEQPDGFVVSTEQGTEERAFNRWLERPRLTLVQPVEGPGDSVVLGRILLAGGKISGVDARGRDRWRRTKTGRRGRLKEYRR
jgi:hypothetical protein